MKAREATAIAESVVAKALQRQGLMYVYLDGGEAKFVKKDSPVFQRAEASGLPGMVGIYSRKCDPAWIKEDLLSASAPKAEKKNHRVTER